MPRLVIAPRKKPMQARSRATVDALIQATAATLVDRGYDALTTNHVAERAGVNIASLYQYFPNKESLVTALVDRRLDTMMRSIWKAHEAAAPLPLARWIERIVDGYLALKLDDPKLFRTLAQQLPRIERLSITVQLKLASVERLTAFFEARRGELRLPPRRCAYAFVQLLTALTEAAAVDDGAVLSNRAHRALLVDVLQRTLLP